MSYGGTGHRCRRPVKNCPEVNTRRSVWWRLAEQATPAQRDPAGAGPGTYYADAAASTLACCLRSLINRGQLFHFGNGALRVEVSEDRSENQIGRG